ncbi:MAG: hypothetical protein GXP27_18885 [Planctomycetes bacterium]|nr:hypothetical protein [Planctomycetota bacterium]
MKATWGSFAVLMACAALAGCTCHQAGYYDPITGLVYSPGPTPAMSWIKCGHDDDEEKDHKKHRARYKTRRPRRFGSRVMASYPNTIAQAPAGPVQTVGPTYSAPECGTGWGGAAAPSPCGPPTPCGSPAPAPPGNCGTCGQNYVGPVPDGMVGSGPVLSGDCPSCENAVVDPANLTPTPECSGCSGKGAPQQSQPSGCSHCGSNHGGTATFAPGSNPAPSGGNSPSAAPNSVPPPPTTEPVPAPPAQTSTWQFSQPAVPQPFQLPPLPGSEPSGVRQASHATKWVPRSPKSGQ